MLVFANNAREAHKIGFRQWSGDDTFLDVRADLMARWRYADYLMTLADPQKLVEKVPHCVDSAPTCPVCEAWGAPIRADGCGCGFCYEEEDT
ncbi:MAG: hypothetical protein ACREQ5_04985 [Candidatus Dormibacteria bacterium]